MNTIPDLAKTAAPAATTQAKAAAPHIKLSPQGVCIDHPDPELGERLMACIGERRSRCDGPGSC